ncbi:hypothetical protein [Trinickia sp. Y13]|uniref:hypothetical protein n=1 Tax=Trinickia sp. Y13 TaxID=2917807 RepID=UPI00240525DD|nr:hypothetical protein [Trinickia sp. Y13]MDG0027357.1 hypothetical protein [Trinickia sp. Y13]
MEWTLPRNFARRDRAGKTSGHDGRSAFRDRFGGNRNNGDGAGNADDASHGEPARTGRIAVRGFNRGDWGQFRHRHSLHEKSTSARQPVQAIQQKNLDFSGFVRTEQRRPAARNAVADQSAARTASPISAVPT